MPPAETTKMDARFDCEQGGVVPGPGIVVDFTGPLGGAREEQAIYLNPEPSTTFEINCVWSATGERFEGKG